MNPLLRLHLLLAAVLLGICLRGASVSAQTDDPSIAIDAGAEGSATDPGETEDCVSVPLGERFQIDMVILNVTDLLAWEIPLDYDPTVVVVVDQDVKLFQAANDGSSVIDISAKLPDDSGFHVLSAFESSDPPKTDTGSGILARITLEAVGEGETPLRFGNRDLDQDGTLDRGVLLRNSAAEVIGDENDDLLFDGEHSDALAVVEGDCPADSNAFVAGTEESDGSSSSPWLFVGIGAAIAVVILGAAVAVVVMSRRKPASAQAGDATGPQQ